MPKNGRTRSATREVTGPRSLARLLGLFDVLAKSKSGMTLAELNQALQSPKSSLLNLLRPMVDDGFLACENGRYHFGPSIFRIAANIMSVWSFPKVMRPYLEELGRLSEESVYMGVLDSVGSRVTCVDAIDSQKVVRFSVPVGAAHPLHSTAAGRVLLAFGDSSWVDDYLASSITSADAPCSSMSRKALREELDNVRKTRLSVSLGEMFSEAGSIAAPVFGFDGKLIAAIAIGAPVSRLEPRLADLRPMISNIANRASGSTRDMLRATQVAGAAFSSL